MIRLRQLLYRRRRPDFSRVRVMMEEAPRAMDHKPAMVTDEWGGMGIIPSIAWEADPFLAPVLSHESTHVELGARISPTASAMFDNLPLKPPNELFARAGVYGWDLHGMSESPKWREMVEDE